MTPTKKVSENKDRCKKYRQKYKDSYRKADAERKRNSRLEQKLLNPELYELEKQSERERMRMFRERKKHRLVKAKDTALPDESPSSSTSTPDSSQSAFTTKQSMCRSLKKAVNALPERPRKKSETLGSLVKRYQLRIDLSGKRGRRAINLSDEEKEWVMNFFDRPDITYINPGRKGNVYVGIINGERKYVQKRYLLWTLRDLLGIMNGKQIHGMENGDTFRDAFDHEISFTLLYNFIKTQKQLIYNRDIPQSSCLCEVCENVCLLAK